MKRILIFMNTKQSPLVNFLIIVVTASIVIAIMLSLAGCGPTSMQLQQTVQVGMAQTEAARPTPTFTVIPPTATSTNTPIPTSTIAPTNTEVPKVALHKLLITISDFANVADFYHPNPLINDQSNTGGLVLDSCSEIFLGTEKTIGGVTINLARYESAAKAKEINDGLKLAAPPFDISSSVTMPDNFWVGADPVGNLYASATQNEILITLQMETTTDITAQDMSALALLLIKNQVIRLKDGDY